MRREMQEAEQRMREDMTRRLSERNEAADILLEKWEKNAAFGDSIKTLHEKNENKARGLAFILENQENHLAKLTETQISSAFGTTPENLLKIVRLAWPNSVDGEIFTKWAMETTHDSMYYLHPVYGKTKRGATVGGKILETAEWRYPTEVEIETAGTGDGSTDTFAYTLTKTPARPYTVKILSDGTPIGSDDGNGKFIGAGVSGTVNYTTGAVSIVFTDAAPAAGIEIGVAYNYDSEVSTNYDEIGSVELQLKDYQFRAKQNPLYISWSKLTELTLGTTLDIDAEDALIRGAADELKKAKDFKAVSTAWSYVKNKLPADIVTFNCQGAVGEPEIDRMNAFGKAMSQAGNKVYDICMRDGVSKLVAGPNAAAQIMLHSRFDASTAQPKVGIYRIGTLDGVDIYKAPTQIIPTASCLTVYKNELVPEDAAMVIASLVELYHTPTMEFKELYKESGFCNFGELKVINPHYFQRINLINIP